MCAGIGFQPGASRLGWLKERLLRVNDALTGHRYLTGIVAPGGLRPTSTRAAWRPCRRARRDRDELAAAVRSVVRSEGAMARFHGTGTVPAETARRWGRWAWRPGPRASPRTSARPALRGVRGARRSPSSPPLRATSPRASTSGRRRPTSRSACCARPSPGCQRARSRPPAAGTAPAPGPRRWGGGGTAWHLLDLAARRARTGRSTACGCAPRPSPTGRSSPPRAGRPRARLPAHQQELRALLRLHGPLTMPNDVLERLLRPLLRGPVTARYPAAPPELPPAARGLPELDTARCDGNAACVTACPTGAIPVGPGSWSSMPGLRLLRRVRGPARRRRSRSGADRARHGHPGRPRGRPIVGGAGMTRPCAVNRRRRT